MACSGEDEQTEPATGGSGNAQSLTGGSTGTPNSSGTGGTTTTTGGATGTGQSSGGAPSSGGLTSVGGAPSTGVTPATGGNPASGGTAGTGGATIGGSTANTGGGTGSFQNTGGVQNIGGSSSDTGGRSGWFQNTGGHAGSGGGTTDTGGQNGGFQNTGGGHAGSGGHGDGGTGTGGQQSTGGATDAGGSPNAGGTTETAGAPGAGGSAGSSPGVTCPAQVLASGDQDKTIQVGGQSRSYVLHVPAAYDGTTPVPLIIDFHGITGNGPGERSSSPYPAQTDAEGVIMAFPTGASGPMGNAWNVGPCCVAGVDDVEFAKAMVSEIQGLACIDPARVYAVGFSMGGGMSHYLACHAADVFAAVAPAAFDLLEENVGDCQPARPITVVSFRGTGDSVVSYSGGYSPVVSGMPITFLGAQKTFETWGEFNECSGAPSAEDGQGCSAYSGCADGVEVVLCTKQGGGHEAGNASIAWPILKSHTLP